MDPSRGRMFQTEFILTSDLSGNSRLIYSTGTVGHPKNLQEKLCENPGF